VAANYHEDPGRLDRLRSGLEDAVKTDSHVENLMALSQACFIWGEVRARSREEKLEAYDRGRQVGQRAVELAPGSVIAHFWYATNTARWGQINAVVRSLFLLPTVREEIETILRLDPGFAPGYALAGNVDYVVPGALGGSLDRAEAMFRRGLELDPRFTAVRVGLARVLIKRGRTADARRELNAVLDEKRPTIPSDWSVKDTRAARALLESSPTDEKRSPPDARAALALSLLPAVPRLVRAHGCGAAARVSMGSAGKVYALHAPEIRMPSAARDRDGSAHPGRRDLTPGSRGPRVP
jgi:Tetratricopeptide repeat